MGKILILESILVADPPEPWRFIKWIRRGFSRKKEAVVQTEWCGGSE